MYLEIKLEKQPIKYLASVDQKTRNKLYRALDKLKNLEGDIVRLKGYKKSLPLQDPTLSHPVLHRPGRESHHRLYHQHPDQYQVLSPKE